jgi:hypothetical protein
VGIPFVIFCCYLFWLLSHITRSLSFQHRCRKGCKPLNLQNLKTPKMLSVPVNLYIHCIALDCIPLHHITSHHITLHYNTWQYITLNHITSQHHNTLHHIISHYITSQDITTHQITWHHTTSHYITSNHITLQHITTHHITLHCITSHYSTSHHITLHVVTSHHINYISSHTFTQWFPLKFADLVLAHAFEREPLNHSTLVPSHLKAQRRSSSPLVCCFFLSQSPRR